MVEHPTLELPHVHIAATPSAMQFNAGTVRVWPSLLVASWGHLKAAGAVRLYCLARSLDLAGSGVVGSVDLWHAAKELKVNRRTFDTWKADALRLGIFRQLKGWPGLRIVSQDKVFKLLNCQTV